jgi:alkanesulfonate monooxygenase SsuD/methylene tetrahydromethanopterin reductase-like flavin-dependent oxidoreductase (luciferase family)
MSFPKPAQKGGIPVHVGGHSPAAARRAGRLGDGFFPAIGEIPKLGELFGLMREEAAKCGRKADAIELSCMGRASLDTIKQFQDIGISRVVVPPPGFDKENLRRGLDQLGNDVIAKL